MKFLKIIGLSFLVSLILTEANALTRDEIITTAQVYYYLYWTCYNSYSPYFDSGSSYWGEAYSYGRWDDTDEFCYRVEDLKLQPVADAGIDCSGYVSRCWELPWKYGTWTLANSDEFYTILRSDVEPGDIFVKASVHTMIYYCTSSDYYVYESIGSGTPYDEHNRVRYHGYDDIDLDGYITRSYFEPTGIEEYYIQVNSPNGGEVWYYDETHNITWNTGTLAETPADSVVIHYSKDGGSTYPYRIAKVVNSSGDFPWYGSYSWTIPRNPSTTCKVRVTGYFQSDPYSHGDASDDNFTIKNPLHLSGWMECINPPKSEVVPMDVYHFRAHLSWTFNASYTPYRYGLYRKLYLPQPGDPTGWTRIYYGQNKSYVDPYDFNIPQGAWYYVRAYITGASYIQSNTIYLEAVSPGCPFLYTYNGSGFIEDNNILAGSGQGEVVEDWYKLREKPPKDGNRYRLEIREENNEHSFFDRVRLIAIDHPDSVEIFATPDSRIISISSMIASQSVTGENGMDYTSNLLYVDSTYVEADEVEKITTKFGEADGGDYIILAPPQPKPILIIEKADASGFEPVGSIRGRENPSYEVLPLTISSPEDVSLMFTFTDISQRLDYIRLGKKNNAPYHIKPCPLLSAVHSNIGSVKQKLLIDDENYAELLLGDSITLEFAVVDIEPGWVRDFVFVSNGYYVTEGEGGAQTAYSNIPMVHSLSLYPNPTRNEMTVRFGIPREEKVSLKVYDISGREVKTLVDGRLEAGYHVLRFDGKDLPSGIYFARLVTDGFEATKKLVLMK